MGAGGYDLVTRLGTGGMAEVFLAQRKGPHGIEHTVVIKRLRDEVRSIPNISKMFTWEAWISSRLCHPNVVGFYDFVSHRGRDHLVLEHVRGPDIATMAKALNAAGRAFPLRAVIEVGIAAARALEHAHGLTDDEGRVLGLVHRDVSPQNILVSVDGQIKLIDFGVAKTTSTHVPRESEPTLVKGKMGYIAPEHLRGQALDARSDLYGLGVVLFEMLTGRPLLRRGADIEMIRAALLTEVPRLTALRPDCPPALDALVRRALSPEPHDRFESAAAMARALFEVGARITEEVGTPTLIDIARDVYAVHDDRRSPESTARIPKLPWNLPRIIEPPGPPPRNAVEPETRPEGISRRVVFSEEPPRRIEAPAETPEPSPMPERSVTLTLPAATTPSWAHVALPIAIAFAIGVLAAVAIAEVMRHGAMPVHKETPGPAAHATPTSGGGMSATEPASKH